MVLTDLVFDPVVFDWRERTASGYQSLALCPIDDIFWLRFVKPRRIAEWEHYRPIHVLRHLLDDFLRECARLRRRAYEDVRFDLFHN